MGISKKNKRNKPNCKYCTIQQIDWELRRIEESLRLITKNKHDKNFIVNLIKIVDQIINSLITSKLDISKKIEMYHRYITFKKAYKLF